MNALRLIAVGALSAFAIAAQTAHADQTSTRAKAPAELVQAKDGRQVTPGELDHPPVVASVDVVSGRSQVVAEPAQARAEGQAPTDELEYPPSIIASGAPAASPVQPEIDSTSGIHTARLIVNFNGKKVWSL